MAVAVHVRVSVGRCVAEQVEGVLPSKAEEDGHQDKDTDNDAVPDKLVGDHRLDEERQQDGREHLGECDYVQFLGVL